MGRIVQMDSDLVSLYGRILDQGVIEVTRGLARRIHDGVTRLTPVRTGRAKVSWNIGVAVPETAIPPKDSGTPVVDVEQSLKKIDGTQIVYITTSIFYGRKLEYGYRRKGKYPGKAGRYMLANTLRVVKSDLEAVVTAARKKLEATGSL